MQARTSGWVGLLIVLWFGASWVLWSVSPILGFAMFLPVHAWVLLGSGASVLKGSWPATFMMEDIQTERGVKLLFLTILVLQAAAVVLVWSV